MSGAPERLYILWDDGMVEDWAEVVCEGADHIEYVRADIHEAEVERLQEERDALKLLLAEARGSVEDNLNQYAQTKLKPRRYLYFKDMLDKIDLALAAGEKR